MSASSKATAGAVNRAGSQFGSLGHPLAGDSDSLLVVLKSIRLCVPMPAHYAGDVTLQVRVLPWRARGALSILHVVGGAGLDEPNKAPNPRRLAGALRCCRAPRYCQWPESDALQAELGIESVAPAFLVALPVFRPTAPPEGEIDDVEEVRRRPGFGPRSGAKGSVSLVLLNVTVQSGAGGGPLGGRALVEHDDVCHPPVAPTTVLPPILARLNRSRGSMASAPRQLSGPSSLAVIQTLTADGSVLVGHFLACRSGAREQGHDNGGGGRRDRTRAGCAHIARATRRPRSAFSCFHIRVHADA